MYCEIFYLKLSLFAKQTQKNEKREILVAVAILGEADLWAMEFTSTLVVNTYIRDNTYAYIPTG